ncbi:hypothetical protein CO608_07290 [Lysobacteraceae bacterium NML08-0793]|nr:hypothetical protein CO608_07290 [Xanthomonadaceae bacterium NML08-0793]
MNGVAVDLIAALAVLQFLFFGFLVGRARGKYGVKAPAVTGHEIFERSYRVQMNTLELLVVFLPALYLAARYWTSAWCVGLGAVYLIGRLIYWRAYVANPANRALGFLLSMLPTMGLLLLALLGIVQALI